MVNDLSKALPLRDLRQLAHVIDLSCCTVEFQPFARTGQCTQCTVVNELSQVPTTSQFLVVQFNSNLSPGQASIHSVQWSTT